MDKHWVSATKKFTWSTPTTGTVQDFDRGTFLGFKASSPEASGAVQAIKPEWTFWDQVTCDAAVTVPNSTGCVFGKHIPTFKTNTKGYPAAAAYYWVLREKLTDHPGGEKYGKPMHRLTDKVQQDHNRDTICNKTGVGKWTAHPDATPDTKGCSATSSPSRQHWRAEASPRRSSTEASASSSTPSSRMTENGGEFYIEVPDHEGCNTEDVCIVRP
ncbi:hypothetical protein [Streptomyces sp. NPDC002132]|uniref:hypothetical protein n=1 Tax=unclassified Streptomyces TaxID=2593676 RepID=UPI0033301563